MRVPADLQGEVEQNLRKNAKRICSGRFLFGDEDAVILTPPNPQADGVVFVVVHPTQPQEIRLARMDTASEEAFANSNIRNCLVVALRAEDPELNYYAAALYRM